jgi:hypothetical protein
MWNAKFCVGCRSWYEPILRDFTRREENMKELFKEWDSRSTLAKNSLVDFPTVGRYIHARAP